MAFINRPESLPYITTASSESELYDKILASRSGWVIVLNTIIPAFSLSLNGVRRGRHGIAIVLPDAQPLKLTLANCENVAIHGGDVSADTYLGNATSTGNNSASVFISNCKGIALRGVALGQGERNMRVNDSTDIALIGCSTSSSRDDALSTSNVQRLLFKDLFSLPDSLYQPRFWYKTDGTAPRYDTDSASGFTFVDSAHRDWWQPVTGGAGHTDVIIINCTVEDLGQGVFGDSNGTVTRGLIKGNDLRTGAGNTLTITGSDLDIQDNVINRATSYLSGRTATLAITAIGSQRVRGGRNTKGANGTITAPSPNTFSANLEAATITGSTDVVAPDYPILPAPLWWPTFTNRQTTPYLGPKQMVNAPTIFGTGGNPSTFAVGSWLSARPGQVRGYTHDMSNGGSAGNGSGPGYLTRWRRPDGTILQAADTTAASKVFQAAAAGQLIVDQSVDGGANWTSSAAVTIA